MLTISKLIIWK